jgi:hypothetical protein
MIDQAIGLCIGQLLFQSFYKQLFEKPLAVKWRHFLPTQKVFLVEERKVLMLPRKSGKNEDQPHTFLAFCRSWLSSVLHESLPSKNGTNLQHKSS